MFIGRYLAADNFVWLHYSDFSAAMSQHTFFNAASQITG
jgi:hypothetical protein